MWADLVVQLAPLLDKHLRLLEDLVVHCRVGYRSSESGVLLLELLETLDLIELQTAVFVTPAIEGLLCDTDGLTDLSNRLALRQAHLGFPKLGDNLLRSTSLARHHNSPF